MADSEPEGRSVANKPALAGVLTSGGEAEAC